MIQSIPILPGRKKEIGREATVREDRKGNGHARMNYGLFGFKFQA